MTVGVRAKGSPVRAVSNRPNSRHCPRKRWRLEGVPLEALMIIETCGRYSKVIMIIETSGRYSKVIMIIETCGRYSKVIMITETCGRYSNVNMITETCGRYSRLYASSRRTSYIQKYLWIVSIATWEIFLMDCF